MRRQRMSFMPIMNAFCQFLFLGHTIECVKRTSIFVFQQKLPRPQPAVDGSVLLTVNVQVVFTLPQVPPLLHFPNGVPFSIFNVD